MIDNLESETSNKDVHVATLDVSREGLDDSPIHGQSSTPSSTNTAESIHNPDATNSPGERPNLSYHFSKYHKKDCLSPSLQT